MVVQVVEPADLEDLATKEELGGYVTQEQGILLRDAAIDLDERVTELEQMAPPSPTDPNPNTQVGPRYTVVTEPTEAAVNKGFADWLADSVYGGGVRQPRSTLVLDFVGTAQFAKPIALGTKAQTGQIQGGIILGRKKRLTRLKPMFSDRPLIQFDGQMRNWHMGELTLESGAVGAKGILHISNNDGNGSNQDGTYDHIEFMGPWEYGMGFSGGAKANLNSEIVFDSLACSNSSYFTDALLRFGMQGQAQEGQFLNYTLRNSKLEGSHGCYLKIVRGGNINIDGFASWMFTGDANNGVPEGTMISMPGGSRFDSEPLVRISGWRPELRGTLAKAIDCAWGSTSMVHIIGLDDTAHAYKIPEFEAYTFSGSGPAIFDDCRFGTWIGVRNSSAKIVARDVRSAPGYGNTGSPRSDDAKMTSLDSPPSGKQGIMRYSGGTRPVNSGVVKSVPASVG